MGSALFQVIVVGSMDGASGGAYAEGSFEHLVKKRKLGSQTSVSESSASVQSCIKSYAPDKKDIEGEYFPKTDRETEFVLLTELHTAETVTEEVVDAWVFHKVQKLEQAVHHLGRLKKRFIVLHQTVVGHVLSSKHIWLACSPKHQKRVQALEQEWRKEAREKSAFFMLGAENQLLLGVKKAPVTFMGGLSHGVYKMEVEALADFMSSSIKCTVPIETIRRAALTLVAKGFREWRSLHHITEEEVFTMFPDTVTRHMLSKVIPIARQVVLLEQRREQVRREHAAMDAPPDVRSAIAIAGLLNENELDAMEVEIKDILKFQGIEGFGCTMKPMDAVLALSGAKDKGHNIMDMLDKHQHITVLKAHTKQLSSVIASLKCWHTFAMKVLMYPEVATLPPRSEAHAISYAQCFSNAKTAYNYIGYVRMICTKEKLSTAWWSDALSGYLKALKANADVLKVGKLMERVNLDEVHIERVVMLADALDDHEMVNIMLTGWGFLMRMQSECFPLEVSYNPVYLVEMPAHRHSIVYVDLKSKPAMLHIRWKQRKNRPCGSHLRRPCECRSRHSNQLCLVHRMAKYIDDKNEGDKLFNIKQQVALRKLRKMLKSLHYDKADMVTWKSMRRGKATELVKVGVNLPTVMEMGEWNTAKVAFTAYVDEDEIDAAQIVEKAANDSSDEEDG